MQIESSAYTLLDSGAGFKLEQIGDRTIVRPSSLCVWEPGLPETEWKQAHSRFDPKGSWTSAPKVTDEWTVDIGGYSMKLRLQQNGQIGFFPEHLSYLPELGGLLSAIQSRRGSAPRVLNLFAYTGLATLWALKHGAEVTHVDLSKRALDWAKENLRLNEMESAGARLIEDDALKFVERELRRSARYDLIIADPPSFSRISKSKTWQFEEIITALIDGCRALLDLEQGYLCLTAHHQIFDKYVLGNFLALRKGESTFSLKTRDLALSEAREGIFVPCGSMCLAEYRA